MADLLSARLPENRAFSVVSPRIRQHAQQMPGGLPVVVGVVVLAAEQVVLDAAHVKPAWAGVTVTGLFLAPSQPVMEVPASPAQATRVTSPRPT
jgi:hypothetical protein